MQGRLSIELTEDALVRDMDQMVVATPKGATVLHDVIRLIQRLGLKVVVEGVETREQVALLLPHGDVAVQG